MGSAGCPLSINGFDIRIQLASELLLPRNRRRSLVSYLDGHRIYVSWRRYVLTVDNTQKGKLHILVCFCRRYLVGVDPLSQFHADATARKTAAQKIGPIGASIPRLYRLISEVWVNLYEGLENTTLRLLLTLAQDNEGFVPSAHS